MVARGPMAVVFTACFAAALLACGGGGPAPEPAASGAPPPATAAPPGPPSLLLVTIDTWRWDYIGASGSGKVATPNLDRLAREGAYDREAETPYPLTTPAHASILTGLWPHHHRVLDCLNYCLPRTTPSLPEAFRAGGYQTAAFVASLSLDRRFGLDRGFDRYDEGQMGVESNRRDGAEVTDSALSFVRERPPGSPLFLWVHYYDLHMPYVRRPQQDPLYPNDPYAAQAAFVDEQVGRLLQALEGEAGRRWRVVVVGDHGEGLGDHGEAGHGLALYRATLHVPLILYPRPERPLRQPAPWRLEDLSPTLRTWFGLAPAAEADGADLFAEGAADRPLPSLTIQPSLQFGVNPCLGLRSGGWMYMRHGVDQLFDLATDPGETRDLAADPGRREVLRALRAATERAIPLRELEAAATPTAQASPAELQALQGLGYLGGLAFDPARLQRADIRSVCQADGELIRAKEAYRGSGDSRGLRAAYGALLRQFPRAAPFYREFGELLLREGDTEGALAAFDRALRLNKNDVTSLVNLAGLMLAKGDSGRARVLYEAALSLNEADPVAHKNLGTLYAQEGRDTKKALEHYRRYLELGGDADAALVREYIARVEAGR